MLPHFSGKLRPQEAKGLAGCMCPARRQEQGSATVQALQSQGGGSYEPPPNKGLGPSDLHSSYRASMSLSFPIFKMGLAEADLRA